MAEVKEDNPVGILYHLLRKAQGESNDKTIKDVWCNVFSVTSPDKFLEQLVDFKMLLERVKKILSDLDVGDFYLEGFDNIESLVNIFSFNESWGQAKSHITTEVMVRLQGAALLVSRKSPNPENDIAAIQADIESLTEQVLKSDSLDAELRDFIVQNLETLRRGLVAYRIGGIEQLQKSFNEVTGSFLINSSDKNQAAIAP